MLSKTYTSKYDSTKKGYESIHKFNYYIQDLFPHTFKASLNQENFKFQI